jgi:hypothetical protein
VIEMKKQKPIEDGMLKKSDEICAECKRSVHETGRLDKINDNWLCLRCIHSKGMENISQKLHRLNKERGKEVEC